jgi:hypothetical protein
VPAIRFSHGLGRLATLGSSRAGMVVYRPVAGTGPLETIALKRPFPACGKLVDYGTQRNCKERKKCHQLNLSAYPTFSSANYQFGIP